MHTSFDDWLQGVPSSADAAASTIRLSCVQNKVQGDTVGIDNLVKYPTIKKLNYFRVKLLLSQGVPLST